MNFIETVYYILAHFARCFPISNCKPKKGTDYRNRFLKILLNGKLADTDKAAGAACGTANADALTGDGFA